MATNPPKHKLTFTLEGLKHPSNPAFLAGELRDIVINEVSAPGDIPKRIPRTAKVYLNRVDCSITFVWEDADERDYTLYPPTPTALEDHRK